MSELRIDPITLEVVKNALASTADEMALVIMRSAYSPVVRDTMDYSTALCDRNGRVVAQGLTLAVQLGTFPTVMGYVLADNWKEVVSTIKKFDLAIAVVVILVAAYALYRFWKKRKGEAAARSSAPS